MYLKSLFFLLLILSGFRAKSQILLNADSTQIRREIGLHGKSMIEKNIEMKGYYHKLIFHSTLLPPEGNSYLMETTFYLTLKNNCFKYNETYWGKDLANQRIAEFNKPSYGLKAVKGGLKWVNTDKGFEATLIPKKIGKLKFASEYILEFKTIPKSKPAP
jgi:hypothetical protein